MRVHLCQLGYTDDEPVGERVERVAALVAAQRGADLVVLPELWAAGGFSYRLWEERAEPVDGPTVRAIADAARRCGAVVHAGSIIEQSADPSGRLCRWNTSVVLGPDGAALATYRKVHRFGFGQGEPVLLQAGEHLVTTPVGGLTLGLATCYDLRFPELFRALLDDGAEMVAVPAAWPAARVEHWSLLGRARAVENQTVMLLCNTVGTHAGYEMGGRSAVIGPTGKVLAEAGATDEAVLVVDVEVADVQRARHDFPVLADRRLPSPQGPVSTPTLGA